MSRSFEPPVFAVYVCEQTDASANPDRDWGDKWLGEFKGIPVFTIAHAQTLSQAHTRVHFYIAYSTHVFTYLHVCTCLINIRAPVGKCPGVCLRVRSSVGVSVLASIQC